MESTLPLPEKNGAHVLTNSLEHKIKELEKRNQELESFAYVASHDLQEPLRKIDIFSQRILDDENNQFSDVTVDHFKRILSATGRMKKLIDALLNYSRTNTDDKLFIKQNLNKILEEVKQNLNDTIVEKEATILSDVLPTMPVIPHQFAQLLENIISNSLKYGRQEVPPVIQIEAREISDVENEILLKSTQPYWHLSIADNGIGFDEQYKERIFELFQRLHGKHEYEGTGIGLAVCKKIVENHGGVINATSVLGQGTTINIYLPIENSIHLKEE